MFCVVDVVVSVLNPASKLLHFENTLELQKCQGFRKLSADRQRWPKSYTTPLHGWSKISKHVAV